MGLNLRHRMPRWLKHLLRPAYAALGPGKLKTELGFWRSVHEAEHGTFAHDHYRDLMLAMAGEPDESFLAGKVVVDFGCGPRGSLVWASSARLRLGVDVLADRYADEFLADLVNHGMVYVKSTERVIPLPSNWADVVYTLNALDHVSQLPAMCAELVRVLKPGGEFIGSLNLEEPPSPTEPQKLTEEMVRTHLLDHLEIVSFRVTRPGRENKYSPFFDVLLPWQPGQQGILWVRARKPA